MTSADTLRRVLPALALVLALAAASPAVGGPALACPGGPDPLRFRPETAIAAVAPEPEPLAIAAAVDPATGREWVALAYLNPAREVAVALSGDGGCTFSAAGGGFLPVVVSAAGMTVTDRPAVALRVAGAPVLVVAWREGRRILARGTATLDGAFGPEVQLDDAALGPPRLAATTTGTALVAAAWLHDDLGAGVPRVTLSATGLDAAAWAAATDVRTPASADDVEVACDLAGAGGEPGCTLLASIATGQAHASRLDAPAGAWSAYRRVDDASSTRLARATLAASSVAGAPQWTALAWASAERNPPGTITIDADAALHDAGALASDFDGATGAPNPTLDPAGAPERRPAVAACASSPTAAPTAFVLFEEAGEIQAARRPLDVARPRLAGGCGPTRLTGLSPARSAGGARSPVAAALGDDVALMFVDDRSGGPEIFFKRSDSVPPAPAITTATAANCGAAPRVDLAWAALPCDVASVVVEVGTAPGGTDFTRNVAPGTGVQVEGLEPGTQYYFRIRVRDTSGNEGVSAEATATTPSCSSADLDASIQAMTDACSVGGAGGDGLADPGETLSVTARYTNSGTATATNARVRLLSRNPAVFVRTPPQDVGDIAAGAFVDAVFAVDVSATAQCGQALEVLARVDAQGVGWADLLPLPIGATCTTCRVAGCSVVPDATRTAPTTICRGAAILLDATASAASNCAGVLIHEWRDGANLLGTGGTLSQSPTMTTTYRLTSSCSTDTDCRAETTVQVTVNQLPSLAFTETPPPPHCVGDVVTLTATSNAAVPAFRWADGTTTPDIVVTVGGTYSCTVTDGNGCQRQRTQRVDFGVIPVADAGPDRIACGGGVIGTTGYPLLDYSWDPPAGLSNPRAAQPIASPATITTYTLTVTDPLTGCSSTDDVTVTPSAPPGPYRDFRLTRNGTSLVATWEVDPASALVRIYADTDARRGAGARGDSATATLTCFGATTCTAPMPVEPLLFLQAVGVCLDGVTEGPNG